MIKEIFFIYTMPIYSRSRHKDLLKGNAEVAEQLGKDIKEYCPDCKHVVVIFNPADITGLITLIYSGLKPSQVTTLAGLDSTRLQSELAKYFKLPQSTVTMRNKMLSYKQPLWDIM